MSRTGSALRVVSETSTNAEDELAQALLLLDVAALVAIDAGDASTGLRLEGAAYLIGRAREHAAAAGGRFGH